jgi:hypothetical protein
MNSEPTPSARAIEFRRALVATANLGPYIRRRPPLKVVIAGVAAFALAGVLTGAAVATATRVDPELVVAQAGAASVARNYIRTENGVLVGHAVVRSASGTQTIDAGERPASATALVEGFGCLDAGHFVALIDSHSFDSFDDCSPGGSGASLVPVPGAGDHILTLRTQKGVRFAVWLSWARIPTLKESAAQKQALADDVITRDEDLAAFNRFAGCMTALGHPLVGVTTGLVPGYSEANAALADGTDNRCYTTEYQGVDAKWQTELSEGKVGVASMAACPPSHREGHSTGPQRRILVTGGILPVLTGCPWTG